MNESKKYYQKHKKKDVWMDIYYEEQRVLEAEKLEGRKIAEKSQAEKIRHYFRKNVLVR